MNGAHLNAAVGDGAWGGRKQVTRHAVKVLMALCAVLVSAAPAYASDITFAVIGPHEYALPVNFKPFNVFVQYGEFNSDGSAYDSHGNEVKGPGTHTWIGLSKYVHFWTFKSLPNVGFAYEVIEPEVRIEGNSLGVSGFADPLTGPAVWIKPSSNSTLGFQSFLQIPVGNSQVSNNYWANYSSMFWDWQLGKFNFDGDLGGVFRSTRHVTGAPDASMGTTVHMNARFAYQVTPLLEPFAALDWMDKGADQIGGIDVPGTDVQETALGAGIMFHFAPKISLTLRYSHGVDGKNTNVTDAGYLKFVYLF